MSQKPSQELLFLALKECSKTEGLELHISTRESALRAATGNASNNGSEMHDPKEALKLGHFPMTFCYDSKTETLPIANGATIVQCRFAALKAFPDLNDVHSFEFVHEGVVFLPCAEEGSLVHWCLANSLLQGLEIRVPLRIEVAPRTRIVRMQRYFPSESARTTGMSIEEALCTSAQCKGKGSLCQEWNIAFGIVQAPSKSSSIDPITVSKLLPAKVANAVLPTLETAYVAFSAKQKVGALSALTVQEVRQGSELHTRHPRGIEAAGTFYDFKKHGKSTFEELPITSEDILQLRFCLPIANSFDGNKSLWQPPIPPKQKCSEKCSGQMQKSAPEGYPDVHLKLQPKEQGPVKHGSVTPCSSKLVGSKQLPSSIDNKGYEQKSSPGSPPESEGWELCSINMSQQAASIDPKFETKSDSEVKPKTRDELDDDGTASVCDPDADVLVAKCSPKKLGSEQPKLSEGDEQLFSIIAPTICERANLVEGPLHQEQLALEIAEKIVFCGLERDTKLCEQLAKSLKMDICQFMAIVERHSCRVMESQEDEHAPIVGFIARKASAIGALTGTSRNWTRESLASASMSLDASQTSRVGGAVLGLVAEASGAGTSAVASAVTLPIVACTLVDAVHTPKQKGIVLVEAFYGEKFEYSVSSCKFVAGIKLRLMVDTQLSAASMSLLDASGSTVQEELELNNADSYKFVMVSECDDPNSLAADKAACAQLCRAHNFRSGIFTATLDGASHAVFPDVSARPKIVVHEPIEYFCAHSTAIVYWDPTFQTWGAEQIPFQVDAISGKPTATLPHFSSFSFRSILSHMNAVLDENELFHPAYDYDFSNMQDASPFRRGGLDYARPCGWQRYAIKVLGKFDNGNDSWLGTDGSAWPVAYHGTIPGSLCSILRDRELRPGAGQVGSATRRSIYLSKDPSYAALYARLSVSQPLQDPDSGRRYQLKMMFQARVRPGSWTVQQQKRAYENEREWLFENKMDIRLYSICVKKQYLN